MRLAINKLFFHLLLASVLPFAGQCADALPTIAVFTDSMGLAAPGANRGPHYLTIAWSDGRIVWARDQQSGGPPYLTAQIEPSRVQQLLKQFAERGVFEKSGLRHSWLGPDSSYQAIWLSSGDDHVQLRTWHELFERNPNVVVINGGVTSLDGRSREEVIGNDTKAFREFRAVWSDLRAAVSGLIPPDGAPYSDAIGFKLPK
jgi:hypothetical protein